MVTTTLSDSIFYPIWKKNFEGQLKDLYHNTAVVDQGDVLMFTGMPYEDFALLVFEERQDLIDLSQN